MLKRIIVIVAMQLIAATAAFAAPHGHQHHRHHRHHHAAAVKPIVAPAPHAAGNLFTAIADSFAARPAVELPTAFPNNPAKIVLASFYGHGEKLNRLTSSKEVFNAKGMTAAHRTLPLGTMIRVTNPTNGASVVLTVNDRGPALWTGRDLDVTYGAAIKLGFARRGTARLQVAVLGRSEWN